MTNSTEMVIKLEDLPNNRFDESILKHYNNNIDFWKQAEPQYFNNALTKDGLMEFDKFELDTLALCMLAPCMSVLCMSVLNNSGCSKSVQRHIGCRIGYRVSCGYKYGQRYLSC